MSDFIEFEKEKNAFNFLLHLYLYRRYIHLLLLFIRDFYMFFVWVHSRQNSKLKFSGLYIFVKALVFVTNMRGENIVVVVEPTSSKSISCVDHVYIFI